MAEITKEGYTADWRDWLRGRDIVGAFDSAQVCCHLHALAARLVNRGSVAYTFGGGNSGTWRLLLTARLHFVLQEHRFSEEQIEYHYSKNYALLRA